MPEGQSLIVMVRSTQFVKDAAPRLHVWNLISAFG
jgi:hypothetical protein